LTKNLDIFYKLYS